MLVQLVGGVGLAVGRATDVLTTGEARALLGLLACVDHGGRGPRRAAAAMASTASAKADPDGASGPSNGSRSWARTVKKDRMASAPSANRRSQFRTVEAMSPRLAAMRRWP